jgi:hypothetical protein
LKTTKNDEHHTCHHDNSKWRHPVTVTDQQEPIIEISSGSGEQEAHWQIVEGTAFGATATATATAASIGIIRKISKRNS